MDRPDHLLQEVTEALCLDEDSDFEDEEETSCALVHEAGYGVVDTGCGRGIIGENTLEKHLVELKKHGGRCEEIEARPHTFRYGNGSSDVSKRKVQFPVYLNGKELRMRVYVVPGEVPLLISKQFLKGLGAQLDPQGNMVHFNKAGISVRLVEKKNGSYQLNLLDKEKPPPQETPEVDILRASYETDKGGYQVAYSVQNGPETEDSECDETAGVQGVMPAHARKELRSNLTEVLQAQGRDQMTMIEVFSPGRFAEKAGQFGFVSRGSFDLSSGWDWSDPIQRKKAEETIALTEPDVLCLPTMRATDYFAAVVTRGQASQWRTACQGHQGGKVDGYRWCARLAERQVKSGRDFLFESSDRSGAWKDVVLQELECRLGQHSVAVPACRPSDH